MEVLVIGTGSLYSKMKNVLKKDDIKAFLDNDKNKQYKKLDDIPIYPVEYISNLSFDKIIIATSFVDEIYKQLEILNIDLNKVFHIENLERRLDYKIHEVNNGKEKNICFFLICGQEHFIKEIVKRLSDNYNIKFILLENSTQIYEMNEYLEWADIWWFDWGNELLQYASNLKLAEEKKIICRIHNYEVFQKFSEKINWENISQIIFVSKYIKDYWKDRNINYKNNIEVVPNGINLNKFKLSNKIKNYNIAFVAIVGFKKGPMMLLHMFNEILKKDNRFELYIAGNIEDERIKEYMYYICKEFGIEKKVHFDGYIKDIDKWLEDKDYIISTSYNEGHPVGVMEAMAMGLKPLIHNYPGSKEQFGKYVWTETRDCLELIEEEYNPSEYRKFIEENYSLEKQLSSIEQIVHNIAYE